MSIVLRIVLILLAVLLVGVFAFAGYILCTRLMRRPRHKKPCPRALEPFLDDLVAMEEKLRELGMEDHYAHSDGYKLHAWLYDQGSGKIAVLLHGIEGSARDRLLDAQYYIDRGYTVLLPDLRACGLSEGRFYGMGEYERRDMQVWLRLLRARFGTDCPIVLDGVSMGASSALLAAADDETESVAAVVADCGFSSARAINAYCLNGLHLPLFPVYPTLRLEMRLLAGYDLNKAAPLDVIRQMRPPVLFLHGEADGYIPCAMSQEMYMLCQSDKAIFTVPGAHHVGSRVTDRAGCEAKMDEFLSRFVEK